MSLRASFILFLIVVVMGGIPILISRMITVSMIENDYTSLPDEFFRHEPNTSSTGSSQDDISSIALEMVAPSGNSSSLSIELEVAAPIGNSSSFSNELMEKIVRAKNKSTVEYRACCGLGHRLSKMVDAYHIARTKNYGFRAFWDFCDNKTESFHYFFGPQPLSELEHVKDGRETIKISNEADCTVPFIRRGDKERCRCPSDYITSNGLFFNSLVERFRFNDEVETFRRKHYFDDHFVLGMHIRAGNGEVGDFSRKNRGIANMTVWVQSISNIVLSLSKTLGDGRPTLLFLATDTASVVEMIRHSLRGKMDVVVYEQNRPPEGSGVIFGQTGPGDQTIQTTGICQDWKNVLMDMMILTSSDVIISGRPSSFTQSLPMGVALSRENRMYCEVNLNTTYQCYQTFKEWCCRGVSFLTKEYLRIPVKTKCEIKPEHILYRPMSETKWLPTMLDRRHLRTFLPYDWDNMD